jgi:hypothetical protein
MTSLRRFRYAVAVLAAGCVLLTILTGPAPAETNASLSVEIRRTASVLWVEASLPRMKARTVKFKVFAPTGPDGRRELWQYCSVDYVGLGMYRCGVDFSRGTEARRADGRWAVRLIIDGDLVVREIFEVPAR